ncbi:DUF4350 domain-containing protein [Evansella sp. AB-rgal1]|uniref:DUF4350 domain-containing protein n=1 Tax=Evansella sp. AB-rgal1 TaxID=3242696 RepID=UPI00359EBB9E
MFQYKQIFLWIIVLLVFFGVSYFGFPKQPQEYPPYVSTSPSPSGVKAMYTYLEEENGEVYRWYREPSHLVSATEASQLLIMVEPYFVPTSEQMISYEEFMRKGNTILLMSENPVGMFDIRIEYGVPSELEEEYSNVYQNGKELKAMIPSYIRLQTREEDEILLTDDGGTLAFKRTYGDGKLIVINSPQWMMNRAILDYDHVTLLLSLINNEGMKGIDAILFDEYVHNQGNAATLMTVYPKWFLLVMLQGAILTLLWLWYRGKRFGPILTAREDTVRFSDEGINAIAAWHLRGRLYKDSIATQADYVKLAMQERWGISYTKDWREISNQLEDKWHGKTNKDIQLFLDNLTNLLKKTNVSKQEYILWAKRLEELRKEVEEG